MAELTHDQWLEALAQEIRQHYVEDKPEAAMEILKRSIPDPLVVQMQGGEQMGRVPLRCPKCGGNVKVIGTKPVVWNTGKLSALIYLHRPAKCDQCAREFVPYITNADLACKLAEVMPEGQILTLDMVQA